MTLFLTSAVGMPLDRAGPYNRKGPTRRLREFRTTEKRRNGVTSSFSLTSIGMPLGSYRSGPSQFQVTLFSNGNTLSCGGFVPFRFCFVPFRFCLSVSGRSVVFWWPR